MELHIESSRSKNSCPSLELMLMRDELSHAMLACCIQWEGDFSTEYIFGICNSKWRAHRNILNQKLSRLEEEGAVVVHRNARFKRSSVRIRDWRQAAASRLALAWSYDTGLAISSYATTRHDARCRNRLDIIEALYRKPLAPKELKEKVYAKSDVRWDHLSDLLASGIVKGPERSIHEGHSYSFVSTPEQYFLMHLHPVLQKAFLFRESLISHGIRRDDFLRDHRGGASHRKLVELLESDILKVRKKKLWLDERYEKRPHQLIADIVAAGCNRLNHALRDMALLYARGIFEGRNSFASADLRDAGAASRYMSTYLKRDAKKGLLRIVADANDVSNMAYRLTDSGRMLFERVFKGSEDLFRYEASAGPADIGIPHVLILEKQPRNAAPCDAYIKLSKEAFGILMVAFNNRDWDMALVHDLASDQERINGYVIPSTLEYRNMAALAAEELKMHRILDRNENLTAQAQKLRRYFVM